MAITIEKLRPAVAALASAAEELCPKFPVPALGLVAGVPTLRHLPQDRDDLLMSYLKCVRSASTLNASLVLLEDGYTFEVGTLCRCVDECSEDVFFMSVPRGDEGLASKDQERHATEFFDEEFDRIAEPMIPAPGRDRVPRQKIRAAIARTPGFLANPSDGQALTQTLGRTFSGFVHSAYVHVMELFGGNPPRFHLRGMLNTPRIPETTEMLAHTTYRAMRAVEVVARRSGAVELGEHLKHISATLAEDGHLVPDSKDAAALFSKLKGGSKNSSRYELDEGLDSSASAMDFIVRDEQGPSRKQQKRTLARLLIARSDLSAAHQALKTILREVKNLKDPLVFPLHAAAIICYARPFTDNDEIGALPARFCRFQTPEAKQAHDDALDVRHRFVAHSDFDARQPQIIPPGSLIGLQNGRELRGATVGARVSTTLLSRPVLVQLDNNCVETINGLHGEIDDLTAALYDGMELPARPFRLRLDDGL